MSTHSQKTAHDSSTASIEHTYHARSIGYSTQSEHIVFPRSLTSTRLARRATTYNDL